MRPSNPRARQRTEPRTRASARRRILPLLLALWGLAVLAAAPLARADNGDVLSVSTVLQGKDVTDIALDTSSNPPGGSFWVAGQLTDKIYHLSRDLRTLLGEIPNPHEVGSIPNLVLTQGLAYRPMTRSLFVLARSSGKWLVKEVSTATGAEVPDGAFEVQTPDAEDVALQGLAFDTLDQKIWFLDAHHEKVFRTDLSGIVDRVFLVPSPVGEQSVMPGGGISFELEELAPLVFEPRIYVPYGDVFSKNPKRIIQLKTTGESTGIEVPLTDLEIPGVSGFQTFRSGFQRRIAVVAAGGNIAQVEQVIPSIVPPSELLCTLSLTNKVDLSWRNNGAGSDRTYGGEIMVLRNDVPFATVPGGQTSFTDTTPLLGAATYALRASEVLDGPFSPVSSPCEATVGTGGLVRWTPVDGGRIWDVAHDPRNGDIYATDNLGIGDGGRILRYDAQLNLVGEVPSPWPRPGGIAFLTSIRIDAVTLENVLAVAKTDGSLVSLITTDGVVKTSFNLAYGTGIGDLAYIPEDQQFAFPSDDVPGRGREIATVDQYGRFVESCAPSDIFNLPDMDLQVAYDPIQEAFLVAFVDGVVRELYVGACVPTLFEFGLDSILGGCTGSASCFGGTAIADNTLVVAGKEANAIFKILIFPYSPTFQRGDFDRGGMVNLTDCVSLANYLFRSGAAPTCPDAADVNDDAVLDISDPIYLLFHLFLEGPPPPPPFPDAGMDPTFRDNLGCDD